MAAQYNLGVLYALGSGVEMDHARSRELFQKAADQGHKLALENLQTMEEAEQAEPADKK
jgi:TPR repeat protein